jgi:hypothetical protein
MLQNAAQRKHSDLSGSTDMSLSHCQIKHFSIEITNNQRSDDI